MIYLLIFSACIWFLSAVAVWRASFVLQPIENNDSPVVDRGAEWPTVSIVVAALDEEDNLERALRSIQALDYPSLQIVAVNDRSRDRTGDIFDAAARDDPRMEVIHNTELPPGWLGKPHALYRGAQRATGEWLLFTDADVVHHPHVLKQAVHRVLIRGRDFLSIIPNNETNSVWIKFFFTQSLSMLVLIIGLWTATRKRQSWEAMGAGAFLLIHRPIYERLGTHAALRWEVVEDIQLSHRARRAGAKTEIALTRTGCRVPWAPSIRRLFSVTRKNSFAVFRYNWLALILASAIVITFNTVLPLLTLTVPNQWLIALVTWLSIASIYRIMRPLTEAPIWGFVFHPFLTLLFIAAAWNSAIHTTCAGGIDWRGTFYPLAQLRRPPSPRSEAHSQDRQDPAV